MEEIYKKIVTHFGRENQKKKAVEELAELIQAVLRDKRDNIVEEIADVEIMINQLKIMYEITEKEIDSVKSLKIKRVLFQAKDKKELQQLLGEIK